MFFAAALLAALPAASDSTANLDFHTGKLTPWQGQGFYLTTATGHGPSLSFAACSSDCGPKGRKGMLYRDIVVPADAAAIRFRAGAVRRRDCDADNRLDVVLQTADRHSVPKQVNNGDGWEAAPRLLPFSDGRPREYQWNVADLAGQTVRIALIDNDDRPGCFVFCGGFRFVRHQEPIGGEFATFMRKLEREHKLAPMVRLDSSHFLAIGNADDEFIVDCLGNCEALYDVFFDHFRNKGFTVRRPPGRLMVAVFDTQEGFEAYLGQKMSTSIRGIYHPQTNRLVVYDYGQNRDFLDAKKRSQQEARQYASGLDQQRVLTSSNRRAQKYRTDANVSTVMHETAHQLSFNCGLLNRNGDVPAWLAEGLACYCEATSNGNWQGIGQPNASRTAALAAALKQKDALLTVRQLVENDDCLRKASTVNQTVLAYAQSWALFRMLMQDRPRDLKKYLALIYERRVPEQRLADFTEVFGTDLAKLDKRYQRYLRDLVDEVPK